MKRFSHVAQYVAPLIGLVGLAMLFLALESRPANWPLARQSLVPIALGLIFRPRPGHPMAGLLGMSRARAATDRMPPDEDGAKNASRDVVRRDMSVLSNERGELEHHAEPVKLVPCIPGETTSGNSWLGGAPKLPDSLEWPHANGAPMLFLAQIALDDLPAGIWGGLRPREGWLAFFMPSQGNIGTDSRVLHINGPAEDRPWPPMNESFHFGCEGDRARAALQAAGLGVLPSPPRFPVCIERHEGPLGVVRRRPSGPNLRDAVQCDYDPRKPEFRPFDNENARILIEVLRMQQLSVLDGSNKFYRPSDAERISRKAAVEQIERLRADLDDDAPLSAPEIDTLIAKLEAIEYSRNERSDIGSDKGMVSVLDDRRYQSDARAAFEILVRDAILEDPARVPPPVRTRFEALWRYDQASEYATMGGAVHSGFDYSSMENPVFLIEIPSSELIGWMFAEAGSIGVFMDPNDLAEGRWTAAWGDMIN